ncbi:SPOR domain-containing protein [Polaribacter aestuariivivens]|uniref:SPOR domain-containing protein n=1 Tax=Polaribacter aestuariivivens TaxID=2304626 RepID=A0A5S3NBT3_9FLAO|nr:SPOR domain-containing protein [Polaribacter aestuariivivens]TMM31904.1 SPOR domain-containing protein [Polaribacter aestuariivivens]
MKNLLLVFCCIIFLSCSKNEKKEEAPIEKIEVKDSITIPEKDEIITAPKLVFTVQIAALKNENEALANLNDVQVFQEDSFTKYRIGSFETYLEAQNFRNQIRKKYKGAFIQALKNNNPISIQEALQ